MTAPGPYVVVASHRGEPYASYGEYDSVLAAETWASAWITAPSTWHVQPATNTS